MGHTDKPVEVENPKILVNKIHNTHYIASFENSPLEARFGATTEAEAIENMVNWFENGALRLDKKATEGTLLAEKFRRTALAIREAQKHLTGI